MKVVLGLAFLCFFIGGIKGSGCGCDDGLENCYCKSSTKYVIKASVDGSSGFRLGNGKMLYKIKTEATYKRQRKFDYVIVPDVCQKELVKNKGRYILMGKKFDSVTLKTPGPNGLIKLKRNLSRAQEKFLRNPDC